MALFQKSVLNQFLKDLDKTKVANAYALFKTHFHNATIQQQIRDSKEEQYQEGFCRDLLVNALGYTLNPQPNYNLTTEQKNETDSKKADGAILKDGNVIAVIELKGTNTTDLNTVTAQAFGYKNNQKNCKYVIISNFEKLRFYIDNAIDFEEFNLFTLTETEFTLLYLCLHCDNLLSDLPNKIKQASTVKEENITKQLYKDYSDLKRKLFTDIVHLNPQYDKLVLFKKSQKLLDRILFILFAEDRNLIQANTIHTILSEFENLKKLDAYQPLYERFKKHFHYLNVGFKNDAYEVYGYNGGLFAEDEILDNIKISDNLLQNYVPILSKYDYETDVDVNILGHIFEHSLNDIEEIQAELDGTAIDKTKTKRKKDGVFYTPKYITKYIVENTVGALCAQKKKEFEINEDEYSHKKGTHTTTKSKALQKLDAYQDWLLHITIVDPACGSGAFLNQALEFLIQEHATIDELRNKFLGGTLTLPNHEIEILENNIFGVDLNEESVEIARLSLWLRTARKGRKLNSLNNNIKCGNSLIDDTSIAGEKAFNWQNEFPEIFERGGFDVVIGNPPYVPAEYINDNEKIYLECEYHSAFGRLNLYPIFYELAIKIAKEFSKIGYITPYTILKNQYYKNAREVILNQCFIDSIIDFSGVNVFPDAGVDSVVFILTVSQKRNNKIEIINNVLDFTKSKYQVSKVNQNELLLKNDLAIEIINSKIDLIRIRNNTVNLVDVLDFNQGIITGDNKAYITTKQGINTKLIITGSDFNGFSLNWNGLFVIYDTTKLHRPRKKEIFETDKIVLRQTGSYPIASYDDKGFYSLDTVHNGILKDKNYNLKYLLCLINSKLLRFLYDQNINESGKLFAQVKIIYVNPLPIKQILISDQQPFIEKAETMLQKNKELQTIKSNVVKLLQSQYSGIHINTKLSNWNELTFKDFIKEVEKQKIKLSISEKAELMQYFEGEQTKANTIQQTITQTDKEIDTMVYKLYELTDEEIAIIENN